MARPVEFDRDQVLGEALSVFWSNGYEASSISKLLDAMKINRGSLYAAFGDKQGLFREVMSSYAVSLSDLMTVLSETENPLEAIQNFFNTAFLGNDVTDLPKGCLLFNTVSELGIRDPELSSEAAVYLNNVRGLFIQRLNEAREKGLITGELDAEASGDALLSLLAGLRTMCKLGADQNRLKPIIQSMLSAILK